MWKVIVFVAVLGSPPAEYPVEQWVRTETQCDEIGQAIFERFEDVLAYDCRRYE